ncbi:hypothetical protein Lfu02_63390 [Longispora fulva]|uniref:CBM-cenC domain-containing protein n=1 Tax=Longispora fulva TaxID=619741 RepID=A0A8J7GBZ8_9ACTN|nr:hypothetical protein [Longispora fulva]MBG6134756.1 hypothetical protein [Longispora fulva]GIG61967.1 hypothetical protein Lfu02_63390 [Longispora fulva]
MQQHPARARATVLLGASLACAATALVGAPAAASAEPTPTRTIVATVTQGTRPTGAPHAGDHWVNGYDLTTDQAAVGTGYSTCDVITVQPRVAISCSYTLRFAAGDPNAGDLLVAETHTTAANDWTTMGAMIGGTGNVTGLIGQIEVHRAGAAISFVGIPH